MTKNEKFIFTNYWITLPNIYCIILFITVAAFSKNYVRDIHSFPSHSITPPDNKKTSDKTFSCLIYMNYSSEFFMAMVLFSWQMKAHYSRLPPLPSLTGLSLILCNLNYSRSPSHLYNFIFHFPLRLRPFKARSFPRSNASRSPRRRIIYSLFSDLAWMVVNS